MPALTIQPHPHRYSVEHPPPATHLVLRLSPNIRPEAAEWLVRKITGSREESGGIELLVYAQPFHKWEKEALILHITATLPGFLECAEYLEFKKRDRRNSLRDFTVSDLDSFLYDRIAYDNLLTRAEKQLIIRQGLKSMKVAESEAFVPGYPDYQLYPGQAVLQLCLRKGLVKSFFPLHEHGPLQDFAESWYLNFSLWKDQPIDEIRNYFGDAIALYYSAASAHTDSLLVPSLVSFLVWTLGLIYEPVGAWAHIVNSLFNVVWVTTALEIWKQRSATLAYDWGTLRMVRMAEPRLNFQGTLEMDPITGHLQRRYPKWKRNLKIATSWSIIFLCLAGVIYAMFRRKEADPGSAFLGFGYGLLIRAMNFVFKTLAIWLTDWENHRTDSKYECHRISKLILFEFVNNFVPLFYIAFWVQDFEMLKAQIQMLLLVHAVAQLLFPIIIQLVKPIWESRDTRNGVEGTVNETWRGWTLERLRLQALPPDDPRINNFKKEANLSEYQDTFDDYLEMWVQFGYVYLFSPIYPLAVVWAIGSSFLELRTDAYKLCRWHQRPFAKRVENVGAWQPAFEFLGILSVMTNCALLGLSKNLKEVAPTWAQPPKVWTAVLILFEHFLLLILLFIKWKLPDIPSKIKILFARQEMEARIALRKMSNAYRRRSISNSVPAPKAGSSNNTSPTFYTPESGSPSAAVMILTRRRRLREDL